jgi:hypothetical protein
MDESGIDQIAQDLSQLLDQRLKALAGRGFQDLTDAETKNYEQRRIRIAMLRAKLAKFEGPTWKVL